MNWSSSWSDTTIDHRDNMSRDEVLIAWQRSQFDLAVAKEKEMDWRKYVAKRAFPTPVEGTNTVDLGNGYKLKGVISYNYNLVENKVVEDTLNEIAKIGNEGAFIAERLVSWKPSFLLTEYRELETQAKDGNETAQQILKLCHNMLVITDAAPKVEIKAPKDKK